MADFLHEIEKQVKEIIGDPSLVGSLDIEGPEIIIYTTDIAKFLSDENMIKKLATTLKKRFVIRSEPARLKPVSEAKAIIDAAIPADAGVESTTFDENFGEVVIEAKKLGLVIGPGGKTLKKISIETGWMPRLLRAPTRESEMVKGIRETMLKEGKDRKKILKRIGRQIYREQTKKTDWIRITALGGCREVGRSCFLIETPESKVLLDCGVSVASVENTFPYLGSVDFSLDELDAIIVSHGHLDHSGFLPYLFSHGYDGPVYCTLPTRDVMALLQLDYLGVLTKTAKTPPYTEKDIKNEIKHCVPRDYGEVTDITPDIRLTLHNAGHILGSSLVHLHIGEGAHNLLYTGDLKFGYTELLDPAETRFPRLETLIIESTYGGYSNVLPPRFNCEKKLIEKIKETTDKNGIVLIPTFAVCRAQEVMLIIEDHARQVGWDVPVYMDGMIKEANAIHTVYPEYLRKNVRGRILHSDSPFDSNIFRAVDPTKRAEIIEEGRCVVLAPAGMMNGGPVIEYFKRTCESEKNSIIFVGYQAQGSLGRKIQRGAKEVVLEDDGKMREFKINMCVDTVEGLSGHADFNQLLGYFKKLFPKPERALIVHGEERNCVNLARTLANKFAVEGLSPRNLDSIRLK